ncbi:hypothetical protein DZA65_04416 [Dickeya dianthicola]|nr:hypothetical protein DZA65_04416 [Dickeya dianthicola]
MQTKTFTRQALDAVAFVSPSDVFFCDGKTNTGMSQRIGAAEDSYLRRTGPLWLLEDERKMAGS